MRLKTPICAFCPMPGIRNCEIPSCRAALCDRHLIRKAGGNLCPDHKDAILIQHEGRPTERFGDRGIAVHCDV